MKDGVKITQGSGNVFADLGIPNPQEEAERCHLALAIKKTIAARGLTQTQAAQRAGLSQPDISNIVGFKRLEDFTCDRLLKVLVALGKNVRITVEDPPAPSETGELTVAYT